MKQLRYLQTIEVDKSTLVKQSNGLKTSVYTKVSDYLIQVQELTDEISASIYGADVNRMYRISSPRYVLEAFLSGKVNSTDDNISLYTVILNGQRYKIRVVRKHWVDIELIGPVQKASI